MKLNHILQLKRDNMVFWKGRPSFVEWNERVEFQTSEATKDEPARFWKSQSICFVVQENGKKMTLTTCHPDPEKVEMEEFQTEQP